ncbi:type II secretion system protein [Halobacteriales archaeon Cl-PHB]
MTGQALLAGLARLYPWPAEASDDLRRSVAFLDWAVEPETVVRAGYGAGLVTAVLATVACLAAPTGLGVPVGLAGIAVCLLAVHVVHAAPGLLALARRTSALGAAPELVVLAVLRMRVAPSPERAAEFAAETGDGPLATSLAGHVRQARGSARTGFERFGDEWREWFPALGRSLGLVEAAGAAPAHDRNRTLDRALQVVLRGTRRQMRAFATDVRAPATGLYAFGVLLPTTLVALLPAGRAAGLPLTPTVVGAVYDLGIPLLLLGAGAWLLARRPVAFPPPTVTAAHPEVPDRRRASLGLGAAVGLGAGLVLAALGLPAWAPPFAAIGLGFGTWLVARFRPFMAVYEDVDAVEAGLTDALTLVGRRVTNGRAVETAVANAADEVDGRMGDVLADAATQQRHLAAGVREAFLGPHGSLAAVPSPRVRGSVAVLAFAARAGAPAGPAILALAEHVDDLQRVEDDARQELTKVCGTLRSTGSLFGPMVAGATVALAESMGGGRLTLSGTAPAMDWLGVAVGWYVLVLAVVLTALGVGLERGLDRPLVGYHVGRALLIAVPTFLASYVLAGAVA